MNPAAPSTPLSDVETEEFLSRPTPEVIDCVRRLDGDFMVLGVGDKMGTTVASMLRRALQAADRDKPRVFGVSRFGRAETRAALTSLGVETLACDLADPEKVSALPRARNVLFLAGQKFGTSDAPEQTWVQNTVVPGIVARHFCDSRMVVFSTGCVYPLMPAPGPGASEREPTAHLGEYAATCVGRERVFSHYSRAFSTPILIFRLNYAVEHRYGVLVDIASNIWNDRPINLSMGWLNFIWQGDACERAIRCLAHTQHPPRILNVSGPQCHRVLDLATELGRRLGKTPRFVGSEAPTAWIADSTESVRLFGPPGTPVPEILDHIASHIRNQGRLLGKPTHFEIRSGNF